MGQNVIIQISNSTQFVELIKSSTKEVKKKQNKRKNKQREKLIKENAKSHFHCFLMFSYCFNTWLRNRSFFFDR